MKPPGVVPLEIWDLVLPRGILWDHMAAGTLVEALGTAVRLLRAGLGRTLSRTPIPELVTRAEAVWLAGGRAEGFDVEALAGSLGLPVWRAPDLRQVSITGARALAPEAEVLMAVDLGQSSLKIDIGDRRSEHPRPWDRLPIRDDTPGDEATARTNLRRFVVEALARARRDGPCDPDAVVFALPCKLEHDPTPGGSSYRGLAGDRTFVGDVLHQAGLRPARILVLNDAELAATAARQDPRTVQTPTLVFTLGFGVGGALLLP